MIWILCYIYIHDYNAARLVLRSEKKHYFKSSSVVPTLLYHKFTSTPSITEKANPQKSIQIKKSLMSGARSLLPVSRFARTITTLCLFVTQNIQIHHFPFGGYKRQAGPTQHVPLEDAGTLSKQH